MMVEVNNPPITAKAIGERSEAPSPKPKHIGSKASMVVKLVIIIGLIRCCAAVLTASVNRDLRLLTDWQHLQAG